MFLIFLQTLMRSYLLKIDGKVAERPAHMLMRVSVGIHKDDIDAAIETYNLMSEKWFTHASPTLFNSGTCKPQLSSCFLLTMSDDSIDGIYETLMTCARISKSAGGIGINVHNIRASGSYIAGVRRQFYFSYIIFKLNLHAKEVKPAYLLLIFILLFVGYSVAFWEITSKEAITQTFDFQLF